MTKKQIAQKEAEAYVRRAVAHLSEKPVSETAIRKAAKQITKALPEIKERAEA